MATIKHIPSGAVYHLPALAHVGRDITCEIHLDNPLASAMHGRLSWSGHTWEVRDLGSSNGTFVNRAPITTGAQIALERGSRIAFGDPGDEFAMVDESPPMVAARSGSEWVYGSENSLELPTPDDPDAGIYCDGEWFIQRFGGDREEHVALVRDRDVIDVAGKRWRIYLPVAHARTHRPDVIKRQLADIALRVQVSLDREHVDIIYVHGGMDINVRPRAHGQVLLYLAMARLEDANLGTLPESEHGWRYRTHVAKALRVDGRRLSLYIWRAKDQARSEAHISDFSELIQSRPDSGQIRLGISRIEILP